MAVANALQLPTLVVAPKIAESSWKRAAEHFGDIISFCGYEKLRTGRTDFGRWENQVEVFHGRREYLFCTTCQQKIDILPRCYAHANGIHCVEVRKEPLVYGKFNFHPGIKLIIFDEAHRCGGMRSLNAELLIAAKRQGIKTLCLTATPACNPLQMRALGYSLGLHGDKLEPVVNGRQLPNFFTWARRYGVRKHPDFRGLHWMLGADKQLEIMAKIRDEIIPAKGVRVTTDSIPDFPGRNIITELYDIPESVKQIDALYESMGDGVLEITRILYARREIERLKIPVCLELASDYMEKGCSVVFFVNFRSTIDELKKHLKCPHIDGSVTGAARDLIIGAFQRNHIRQLIVNNDAGGICISLQDLQGDAPRVGLVFPGFSATSMRQVFGRLARDGGKSDAIYRVILAAGVKVDQKVHRLLSRKLNNLDALVDSDLWPDNLKIRHTI